MLPNFGSIGHTSGLLVDRADREQSEAKEANFTASHQLLDPADALQAARAETSNLDSQGWGGGTWEDIDNWFQSVNNLFHSDQETYKQWAQAHPEFATRFHAQAAERGASTGPESWASQWDPKQHESAAFGLGYSLYGPNGSKEDWGTDFKNDGKFYVPTYSFGSEVTPDISSDPYNNVKDFWRIGSVNTGKGGLKDFVDDNPWVIPAAALSFWGGPAIAGWAGNALGGGTLGAIGGSAASGALLSGGTTLLQGGSLSDVLESAATGGLQGLATAGLEHWSGFDDLYLKPGEDAGWFEKAGSFLANQGIEVAEDWTKGQILDALGVTDAVNASATDGGAGITGLLGTLAGGALGAVAGGNGGNNGGGSNWDGDFRKIQAPTGQANFQPVDYGPMPDQRQVGEVGLLGQYNPQAAAAYPSLPQQQPTVPNTGPLGAAPAGGALAGAAQAGGTLAGGAPAGGMGAAAVNQGVAGWLAETEKSGQMKTGYSPIQNQGGGMGLAPPPNKQDTFGTLSQILNKGYTGGLL